MSCLTEQAKILREQAEEYNLGVKAENERWARWHTCSLCEQRYHGVVKCALGWACWKTYVDRPEADSCRIMAMNLLGGGLADAGRNEDALLVKEAELSMKRRLGDEEDGILIAQSNVACTYSDLGRHEEALLMRRNVYSGTLRLYGEEHEDTLLETYNYADSLVNLERFEEAKALLRKMMPVARHVFGDCHEDMLRLRWTYADALYSDPGATLDDLREAVTTLEETTRTTRRVMGRAHPLAMNIESSLRESREALSARDVSSISEAFAAMTRGMRKTIHLLVAKSRKTVNSQWAAPPPASACPVIEKMCDHTSTASHQDRRWACYGRSSPWNRPVCRATRQTRRTLKY